ncbi:MAG: hypothetical protein U5Q44_09065 [Dehalococcoidia bacterium]|nr:hypothetical protein [Dehalococcoidia bacterium]
MSLPFALQDHETVLLRCRRHAIYVYPRLVAIALVAIAPVVVLLLVTTHPAAIAASAVWVAFWVANAYLVWFRYRNDMWVVTNQRVVDSVKRHWFHHRMASTDLVDVEDIADPALGRPSDGPELRERPAADGWRAGEFRPHRHTRPGGRPGHH